MYVLYARMLTVPKLEKNALWVNMLASSGPKEFATIHRKKSVAIKVIIWIFKMGLYFWTAKQYANWIINMLNTTKFKF